MSVQSAHKRGYVWRLLCRNLRFRYRSLYERTTAKYSARGVRHVHMEVGHAAQDVYLQVVGLDLGTVVIGAFDDAGVKRVAHLSENEQPLYLLPIGRE
jgi:SagB-type dehydrogenase family enzyme